MSKKLIADSVEVARTRLRQASTKHAACFLLTVPMREETQALGDLYAAARNLSRAEDAAFLDAVDLVLRVYRRTSASRLPDDLRIALGELDRVARKR